MDSKRFADNYFLNKELEIVRHMTANAGTGN